jgi:NAD dependent epimerase/dehydratase family
MPIPELRNVPVAVTGGAGFIGSHLVDALAERGASIVVLDDLFTGFERNLEQVTVGRYAFIAAGAVVAKGVADYALIMGVPGRKVGWVSRHGLPLRNADADGVYTCPESGLRYREVEPGILRCLNLDEDAPLSEPMKKGSTYYDDIVHGRRLT